MLTQLQNAGVEAEVVAPLEVKHLVDLDEVSVVVEELFEVRQEGDAEVLEEVGTEAVVVVVAEGGREGYKLMPATAFCRVMMFLLVPMNQNNNNKIFASSSAGQ